MIWYTGFLMLIIIISAFTAATEDDHKAASFLLFEALLLTPIFVYLLWELT